MALPAAGPAHVLLYPGHASLSALLFRQWARNSPASDSSAVARALRYDLLFGDSAEQARAAQRQPWFFAQPWGSQAWQDGLAAHGLTMDSAIALVDKSGRFYGNDRAQMPPLATFIPDTAAMALLGEWVKGYAAVNAGIRAARPARGAPVLSGRVLRLPAGWDGASVLDVAGRVYPLRPLGGGAYALPERAPAGVLFIRARTSPDGGARVFRLAGGITGS